MRYEFGKNWEDFVKSSLNEERLKVSREHILRFLGMNDLEGLTFLDIGCGSGLSSLAALTAGARKVVAFDYDVDSVETARMLLERSGVDPARWTVMQGSVLDEPFMERLEKPDVVYSWGVLHHTGEQWRALRNAASRLKPGGLLYVALYTSDAYIDPPPEFWLDVKQRYNRAGPRERRKMELWYVWRFSLGGNPLRLPLLVKRIIDYRKNRGMSFWHDVRDWLGGWPMEFSSIAEVKTFGKELGLTLENMTAGQANTEYLFRAPS